MTPKPYLPPFDVTPKALTRLSEIMRLVGRYEGLLSPPPQPKLRRQNRIRTVVGSLAIEGNTLSMEQATAIMDNKRSSAPSAKYSRYGTPSRRTRKRRPTTPHDHEISSRHIGR